MIRRMIMRIICLAQVFSSTENHLSSSLLSAESAFIFIWAEIHYYDVLIVCYLFLFKAFFFRWFYSLTDWYVILATKDADENELQLWFSMKHKQHRSLIYGQLFRVQSARWLSFLLNEVEHCLDDIFVAIVAKNIKRKKRKKKSSVHWWNGNWWRCLQTSNGSIWLRFIHCIVRFIFISLFFINYYCYVVLKIFKQNKKLCERILLLNEMTTVCSLLLLWNVSVQF